MTLLVQDFLRSNSVQSLCDKYSILAKQHSKYPNLYLLKYDQIKSNMKDSLVQECRGIILDQDQDWKVISFPYTKFFNYGESEAAEIDWRTAQIYEKLDGSLCTLYWYDNKWNVATSGTPDASGEVNGFGMTFEKLFWDVWEQLGYDAPNDRLCCYMFELCTKYNRIIVQHKKSRLVLHGARSILEECSFAEVEPQLAVQETLLRSNNWEVVQRYPLGSVKDILDSLHSMSPTEQEGYVVVDAKFNRIKVKSPRYVALHRMIDGMSSKRMLEIVRTNESSEFLSYFPEWAELYNEIKDKYFALLIEVNQCYNQFKSIENQKEFALAVKDFAFRGALFTMRNGKVKSFE